MQTAHNCRRERFLRYHWGKRGLQSKSLSLPLINGALIHKALERILRGADLDYVIASEIASYRGLITAHDISDEEVSEHMRGEQEALLEGLLRAWVKVRLPKVKAEYDIVWIEPEILWEMAPEDGDHPAVVDMVRPDLLLRRRDDGTLFYQEWKSTSSGDAEWATQWEHNSQVLANCLALEEVLGERVLGVVFEGIIKGWRGQDKARRSPFYGRRNPTFLRVLRLEAGRPDADLRDGLPSWLWMDEGRDLA